MLISLMHEIEDVVDSYKRRMDNALGKGFCNRRNIIEALHELGYLPIEIRAVEEGEQCGYSYTMYDYS